MRERVGGLRQLVETVNACALPGCTLKYDSFVCTLWNAAQQGYVPHDSAHFVAQGLRHGFNPGIDCDHPALQGHRWFSNYGSALMNAAAVSKAITSRLQSQKTIDLGEWSAPLAAELRDCFDHSRIFPMGCVAKKDTSDMRPTSDHSRTGVNDATIMDFFRHPLTALGDVCWYAQQGHFMAVSDVADAFLTIPLHPDVWQFFMSRFDASGTGKLHLYMHLFGDFGAAGMPGTFYHLFARCVMGMARCCMRLTLPMTIYVDDICCVGPDPEQVNAEIKALQWFGMEICGVLFKVAKDRPAHQCQLYLGFVWNTLEGTRTLEEKKLQSYCEAIAYLATLTSVSLRELRSMAGKLQRACMTFPPGAACLLVSFFALMAGLKYPWQRRRLPKGTRMDMQFILSLLGMNHGRGYYRVDDLPEGPHVQSDACTSRAMAGGGYITSDGHYGWWKYGARAAKRPIDFLEGDTVTETVRRRAHGWRGKRVPFGCDNMSFERSAAKGRSRADRLNVLLREIFALMLHYGCVLQFYWLSSEDNLLADHLSRGREQEALEAAVELGFWSAEVTQQPDPDLGETRRLPERRGVLPTLPPVDVPAAATAAAPAAAPAAAGAPRRVRRSSSCPALMRSTLMLLCFFTLLCPAAAAGSHTRSATAGAAVLSAGSAMAASMPLWLPFICFFMLLGEVAATGSYARAQANSVSHGSRSIWTDMPGDMQRVVEQVLSNRLATSSWRTVQGALRLWRPLAGQRGWGVVIATDDPQAGMKMTVFVMTLMLNTNLVYKSISNYVWGLRSWMQHQRQQDPVAGVREWGLVMKSIKVLTWVPGEPRRRTPISVVKRVLRLVNQAVFWQVQMAFLILTLLYTYSRSECPCPKAHTGRDSFDPEAHWQVRDFQFRTRIGLDCPHGIWVRFKRIKQDPRVERPETRGRLGGDGDAGDWAFIGDIAEHELLSIVFWWRKMVFLRAEQQEADLDAPMFVDPDDLSRAMTYSQALRDWHFLQELAGVPEAEQTGLHGLRVAGHDGTKWVLGSDVAEAHGLWKSGNNERYSRFKLSLVGKIPWAIMQLLGVEEQPSGRAGGSQDPLEREVAPPAQRLTREALQQQSEEPADLAEHLVVLHELESVASSPDRDAVPGQLPAPVEAALQELDGMESGFDASSSEDEVGPAWYWAPPAGPTRSRRARVAPTQPEPRGTPSPRRRRR